MFAMLEMAIALYALLLPSLLQSISGWMDGVAVQLTLAQWYLLQGSRSLVFAGHSGICNGNEFCFGAESRRTHTAIAGKTLRPEHDRGSRRGTVPAVEFAGAGLDRFGEDHSLAWIGGRWRGFGIVVFYTVRCGCLSAD